VSNAGHAEVHVLAHRRTPFLEIRQIRYFVAIYEARSVKKASTRLLVAQSALSQQLAQLEDELGVQLFTRSPHGVLPTAFGELFYDHSLEILRKISDAVESVRQFGQNPRGIVNVGMLETISIVLGLPLLQSVKQRLPDVQLQLTEDISANLKGKLKEGEIELAVVFDDGVWEGLSAQPLVTERLYLVSRASVTPGKPVTLPEALSFPLVLPDTRDGLRIIIESAAHRAGLTISNLVSEVSSLTVIKNAVLQGLGATILPISCVSIEVQQGALQAQEIAVPDVACTVVLCTRKGAPLPQAAASVFRLTVATATELCTDNNWVGGAIVQDGTASHS
jgi:LysR family transcriptional regulator, nitrogen assimilation regulatory protein